MSHSERIKEPALSEEAPKIPQASVCSVCETRLPHGIREEFCPTCAVADDSPSVSGRVLGDCELFGEIGRGGMGVVWRGRQRGLHRDVAVKTMTGGEFASEAARVRFRREAQAAARLQHPGIVAVYEVGEDDSMPYFIMELVKGSTMAAAMAEKPVSVRQAAKWLYEVALAIEHAHSQGVLHRDIKPSNILIEPSGRPRVADFGLARLENQGEEAAALTVSGSIAGSPAYMSPEQACGKDVTVQSDVYSMGAVLYHLLVNRPPFQGDSVAIVLSLVAHEEPVAPKLLNPSVPRDLETICLKCLEKTQGHRYMSAKALADDLGRFLEGTPVLARPIGRVESLLRLARRRPIHAAAVGLGLALLATIMIGLVWQRGIDKDHLAELGREQSATREALAMARLGEAKSLLSLRLADSRSRSEKILNQIFDEEQLPPQLLADAREARLGALALDSAHPEHFCGEAARMEDYTFLALSPDHSLWAQADFHGSITLYQRVDGGPVLTIKTENRKITALLGFSPKGRYLAVRHDADYVLWDCSQEVPAGASRLIFQTALWRKGTAFRSGRVAISPDELNVVWTSAEGQLLSAALPNGVSQQFPPRVNEVGASKPPSDWGTVAFSGDGQHLLAASSRESVAMLYSWPSGTLEHTLTAPGQGGFSAIALNADASLVAAGTFSQSVAVWRTANDGGSPRLGVGHENTISSLAFSPDGRWLASVGEEAILRLWDANSAAPVLSFPGESLGANFTADSKFVGPLLHQGIATRLRLEPSPLFRALTLPGGRGSGLAMALDTAAQRLAVSCNEGVALLSVETGAVLQILPSASNTSVQWVNNDTALLTCTPSGIQRWDVSQRSPETTGETLFTSGRYSWMGLSADTNGSLAASVDRETRAIVFRTSGATDPVYFPVQSPGNATLSPDGQQLLVSMSYVGGATAFDVRSRQAIQQLTLPPRHNVIWSSDGRWAAGSGSTHTVWGSETWQPLSLPSLDPNVYPNGGCAFTDCGGKYPLVALVEGNSRIVLISLPDCQIRSRLEAPGSPAIAELALSRDGHWLIAACARDGCLRWDIHAIRALDGW